VDFDHVPILIRLVILEYDVDFDHVAIFIRLVILEYEIVDRFFT
jgi:hypothetical protein